MLKRSRYLPMLSISLFSLLIMLLSACGAPTTPNQQSGGTPVKGGVWTDDLFEEPDSFIPNASSETFSNLVDNTIWAPLFYGDAAGHITPGLVATLPTVQNGGISSDLKTWKFTLRPNLKWSDGQPLDARDVDYTWKLWTNPKFTPANSNGFNLITSADISADNLTITFHLKAGFSPFLSIWTDGLNAPMPAHVFSSMTPEQILVSPEHLLPSVASGPFKMTQSKPGSSYTVSRNDNYYQAAAGLPYLNEIVFRITPDQNTILKDLQSGSIDSSWFLDVTKTIAYKALTNYTLSANPHSSNFEAIYFNFRNKILGQNPDVRKAISMAIDHQALIDTARRGEAVPLCTDHGQSYVPGYQKDVTCPTFDPTGAANMLQADGWVKGADGVRTKNGERLEFQYSTTAGNYWRADDELVMQSDMSAIGIKLDITNYPASTFFGPFLNGGDPNKYNIAEFEDSFSYDGDDVSLESCAAIPPGGSNFSFYCNHSLDALFAQEEATIDPTARQAIFNQIHQIYLTEFPFVTLYGPVDIAMSKNTTHNYTPGPEGASETVGVMNWWCTNAQC